MLTLINPNTFLPVRATYDSAGADLCSIISYRLRPGERYIFPTGLLIEIPTGKVGLICPRSGLAVQHGITVLNSPGVIDPDYRGEVKVCLLNTDPVTDFQVSVGDRIAQLLILHSSPDMLPLAANAKERGTGGFGSTDTKLAAYDTNLPLYFTPSEGGKWQEYVDGPRPVREDFLGLLEFTLNRKLNFVYLHDVAAHSFCQRSPHTGKILWRWDITNGQTD